MSTDAMMPFPNNDFIFSSRYHIWRHIVFWFVDVMIWAAFWTLSQNTFARNVYHMLLWLPVFLLYSYPLVYWVVPKYLLKGRYVTFIAIILFWGGMGWFINIYFRLYVFIPAQEAMHYKKIVRGGAMPGSYLCLITTTSGTILFAIFKHWILKQRQWLEAQKEKVVAELQLLKAQVHPHFLFNTLNNIYSFSLENSPKTPVMILKLSSLLRYMLYECRDEVVLLEKELAIMKNYIDLERERYGNKLEISWAVETDQQDLYIAPLIFLPFIENAFKHGTSEQVEKPWLSVDLAVRATTLKCKIVNSKDEFIPYHSHGIGISNVKKRLELIYPGVHDLKLNDEGNFFVVSLLIKLNKAENASLTIPHTLPEKLMNHEASLPAYR